MNSKKNKVSFKKHVLDFRFDAGTSRGVLKSKVTYYIIIRDEKSSRILGLGEAGPLKGLSIDDRPDFEEQVKTYCSMAENLLKEGASPADLLSQIAPEFPAIRFGMETALQDVRHGGERIFFDNAFSSTNEGIPINGLIWMGSKEKMLEQIGAKLKEGYKCIKLKIGAINFEEECDLLAFIRSQFSAEEVMLRVDANGAFKPGEAMEKLEKLSSYELHSIEQPIPVQNVDAMKFLCANSPLAIALDEELIGINDSEEKVQLLQHIQPQYIILKPTLLGGFSATDEWINIAEQMNIGWWITSALESNIGLNAIAQYTAAKTYHAYQGLGTGQLFHNNIPSPLTISQGCLYYNRAMNWDLTFFEQ